MTFRFDNKLGDLNNLTPADAVAFLHEVMKPGRRDKTPPTHLRNLSRFLISTHSRTNLRSVRRPPRAARRSLRAAHAALRKQFARCDRSLSTVSFRPLDHRSRRSVPCSHAYWSCSLPPGSRRNHCNREK
jgi:hypothetical protein